MARRVPNIGLWYRNKDNGDLFEVVSIDESAGAIDIQYDSGDIDEIEFDEWLEMDLKVSAPPDDQSSDLEFDEELEESTPNDDLWGLHLNDMDLQGFDSLDWREPY